MRGVSGERARRLLARDVGGMPLWALVLVIVAGLVVAGVLGSGSAARSRVPQYTAPTGATSPTIPAPMPLAVFIGDSYTQGAGGAGVEWPALVAGGRAWDVDNLGLGGTGYMTTSDVNGCGRTYCGSYLEVIDEIIGSPAYIVVAGGRNDLRLPAPEVGAAADALFDGLRDRFPHAEIMVVNPWFDDDPVPSEMEGLSASIRAAADAHDVTYLDTGQPLLGRPDLISEDGVHPNAEGYRTLAAAVSAALDRAVAG
jgi:lysophospholipase L1-like esterase